MENANGTGEEDSTRHERERFNMCYLFSNLQVTRRDITTNEESETTEAAAVMVAAVQKREPINIF